MSMSREAKKEVERFLREGRKIAAIKHHIFQYAPVTFATGKH